MLTSRAEYRISLRADNADMRLTQKGYEAGCVSLERMKLFEDKQRKINSAMEKLASVVLSPKAWNKV